MKDRGIYAFNPYSSNLVSSVHMTKMQEGIYVTIIMPALNEEKNIIPALDDTLSAFDEFDIKGEIVAINDGSTDSTPLLIKQKSEEFPGRIRIVNHSAPQGIGASFWDGADEASGDIVCMLPGDNENDPREILRYLPLLEKVDIVIPYVDDRKSRPRLRNFLSSLYHFIINSTFSTSLKYTNGTILYRKSLLKELDKREKGFFFQTDILMRLIKRGYLFAEVPYRLRKRRGGKSKAVTLRSLSGVVKGYLRLIKDLYLKKRRVENRYAPDSISAERYKKVRTDN